MAAENLDGVHQALWGRRSNGHSGWQSADTAGKSPGELGSDRRAERNHRRAREGTNLPFYQTDVRGNHNVTQYKIRCECMINDNET